MANIKPVAMRFPVPMVDALDGHARRFDTSRHDIILTAVAYWLKAQRSAAADRAQEMFDE